MSLAAAPTTSVPYAPSWVSTGVVLAGRAGFRALWMVAPLLLATTWTAEELGRTVAVIGGFGWLAILFATAEKTLLKQVPRLPRLAGQVSRQTLATVLVPLACVLAAATLSTLTGVGPTLLLWGLCWGLTGAVYQVVAALHRLAHRPGADALLFASGALALLAATGVTVALDLRPVAWVVTCLVLLLAVAAAGLAAVPREMFDGVRRRAAVTPLRRSLLLLGLPEVLSIVSVSAGFWAVAAFAPEHEAVRYYVAVTVASVFGATTTVVVRLHQPDVSLRLRGSGAAAGEDAARRILARAVVAGAGTAALAVGAHLLGAPWWATLTLLTAGEVVVFTQRTVAANLVENSRSRWLPGNVGASACGLLAAAVVLLTCTGRGGALAAMGALVAAQLCNATALRLLLRRASGRRVPQPISGRWT